MKSFSYTLLIGWVLFISYGVASMHSWHTVDLSPANESLLSFSKIARPVDRFGALHFLTPHCSCSKEVFDHLVSKGPNQSKEIKEFIITIDDDKQAFTKPLLNKGYDVLNFSTEQLQKELASSIRGVPLLLIYNAKKEVRYVGGYSDKAITPFSTINLDPFFEAVQTGRSLASKPVKGCAISKKYKELLDPLGLKY